MPDWCWLHENDRMSNWRSQIADTISEWLDVLPQRLSSSLYLMRIHWVWVLHLTTANRPIFLLVNHTNDIILDEYFSATVFWVTELLCGGSLRLMLERGNFLRKHISRGSVATHIRLVGSLVTTLLQIYCWVYGWKRFGNWLRFVERCRLEFGIFFFSGHNVHCASKTSHIWLAIILTYTIRLR